MGAKYNDIEWGVVARSLNLHDFFIRIDFGYVIIPYVTGPAE